MNSPAATGTRLAANDRRWLLAIAAAVSVALFVATLVGPYGYFIDEFYYLACARRPALGYVDHPPLAPLVLAVVRAIAGESLLAIRVVPALCAGATAYLTGLLAHQLGGGRFAICLAPICVAAMPFVGVVSTFFSMNAIELVLWAGALLVLARIADGASPKTWLVFGLIVGLGFLNKHTIVLLIAGVGIGVLATPMRRHLRTPWPWLGAALALLLIAPNLLWQIANAWPSLEFYRQATALKNMPTSPLGVLVNTLLLFHPLLVLIWGAGAVALVISPRFRKFRALGVAFWVLLALIMAARTSRSDRIAPVSVVAFAAGAVLWEQWLRSRGARAALTAAVVIAGALLAPLSLPILPFETTAKYQGVVHAAPRIERGKTSPLPQWLADRTGWEDFRLQMDEVMRSLSPEDRARAVVYAADYGHAGALELWGAARSFPPVISPQNSYYHWSIGHTDSDILVTVGASERGLRKLFADVEQVGTVRCVYCMSWRNDRPIHVARRPIVPLSSVWPGFKHYE